MRIAHFPGLVFVALAISVFAATAAAQTPSESDQDEVEADGDVDDSESTESAETDDTCGGAPVVCTPNSTWCDGRDFCFCSPCGDYGGCDVDCSMTPRGGCDPVRGCYDLDSDGDEPLVSCTPGETKCIDGVFVGCADSGHEWEGWVLCGDDGGSCDPIEGCVPPDWGEGEDTCSGTPGLCTPGDTKCGDIATPCTCNACGDGWVCDADCAMTPTATCDPKKGCVDDGGYHSSSSSDCRSTAPNSDWPAFLFVLLAAFSRRRRRLIFG